MFLRSTERKKDGKTHRYFSVVENRRLPGSRTVQRTVLYLGEINDQQQAAWRRSLEVFDEDELGAAKKEAGRAFGFVKILMPPVGQAVTRETFSFQVDKAKLKATEQRDGRYLLRSNLTGEDPAVLWTRYVQLTQIESVFRSLKSELSIRPIGHQLEHRADAHVLIAFLAYSLQVTLKNRLTMHAPGLTPAAVFEKLATIQMVEVWIPMVDGRWLVMPRHTQPEPDVQALLNQIRITLPAQPPPRIKASQITSK
jgi:hypothetical protein